MSICFIVYFFIYFITYYSPDIKSGCLVQRSNICLAIKMFIRYLTRHRYIWGSVSGYEQTLISEICILYQTTPLGWVVTVSAIQHQRTRIILFQNYKSNQSYKIFHNASKRKYTISMSKIWLMNVRKQGFYFGLIYFTSFFQLHDSNDTLR